MKKAVIFDLDGTLLNTLEDLADSVNYALSSLSMPSRPIEEIKRFLGTGNKMLIHQSVPENTSEEDEKKCLDLFFEYYSAHSLVKTKPYDGIMDVLRELKARNIKMAIVSNKFQGGVDILAKEVFEGIVDVAIGAREGVKTKPSSEPINLALEALGEKKGNCIYVGDSDVDIATANNSNLDFVCVTWGFRDKAFLKEKGAINIVDSPKQLLDYFN